MSSFFKNILRSVHQYDPFRNHLRVIPSKILLKLMRIFQEFSLRILQELLQRIFQQFLLRTLLEFFLGIFLEFWKPSRSFYRESLQFFLGILQEFLIRTLIEFLLGIFQLFDIESQKSEMKTIRQNYENSQWIPLRICRSSSWSTADSIFVLGSCNKFFWKSSYSFYA